VRFATLLRRLADARLLPASGAGSARAGGARADRALPEATRSVEITHLADDSREVGPGGLFVAIRGTEADGHRFIGAALDNGAAAVLCEEEPADVPEDAAVVRVGDTRAALAEVAAGFYGAPSRELKLTGVTGTNGKTTTAYLVRHALRALEEQTALIGTVETDLGDGPTEATLTTPGPIQLQEMLRTAAGNGCTAGAMEVSSHALDQQRTRATRFAVGVFTNLSPEHLDYHGTLANYRAAKKRLFDALPAGSVALYNTDDEAGEAVVADTKARAVSFGEEGDVRLEVVENRIEGLRLRLDGAAPRAFRLVGRFNAYNLAAAYGAARAMGYRQGETLDALQEAPPVPGRFEQRSFPAGSEGGHARTVVVDYAHTPDALENVLRTARAVKAEEATLWCVFGCGGDRDRTKRPAMGRVAERLADRILVTSDNPRTEEPGAIIEEIHGGLENPQGAIFEEDRRAAIREAARQAQPGDVVVIAGKGHEPYQVVGTEKRPFDDRRVARECFTA
jgi:UDP-N-acetylmuramoyl-L-alanyl-D-glutamate--2,6-diaminopimelate ligase